MHGPLYYAGIESNHKGTLTLNSPIKCTLKPAKTVPCALSEINRSTPNIHWYFTLVFYTGILIHYCNSTNWLYVINRTFLCNFYKTLHVISNYTNVHYANICSFLIFLCCTLVSHTVLYCIPTSQNVLTFCFCRYYIS